MNIPQSPLTAQDIMQPCPLQLEEDASLDVIFRGLSVQSPACIAVVDTESRLQGCILQEDLHRSRQLFDLKEYIAIIADSLEPDLRQHLIMSCSLDGPINLRAREVMSVRTPQVAPQDDIQAMTRQFLASNSHYALVVDSERHVLGMVSTFDILGSLQQEAL